MEPAVSEATTHDRLVDAARACLLETGFAGLSTRRVAERAGVPLSQIHYHFGAKQGLVLAVLAAENERLLERQRRMYAQDLPLWRRWEQACDFLEDDLESGYVRVLHEMHAAGWSDPRVAQAVRELQKGWLELLTSVAREAAIPLGPFSPEEVAALVAAAFLGGEEMILTGFEEQTLPVRLALRKIGLLIRAAENQKAEERA